MIDRRARQAFLVYAMDGWEVFSAEQPNRRHNDLSPAGFESLCDEPTRRGWGATEFERAGVR